MSKRAVCRGWVGLLMVCGATRLPAQIATPPEAKPAATHADILRGEYGPYRANNHLLSYHLDLRVDPEKKFISGKNTIRFRMLADGTRIQLDLTDTLAVDRILFVAGARKKGAALKYERDSGAVFVDFPETLRAGRVYAIDFYYSGNPVETGRFGCFGFGKDAAGRDWITTACEDEGASLWWPNKDQWRDRVESMEISVAAPNGLTDVSNGRLVGKKDLGDGYTRWDWRVHYPIDNYDVALNIGDYAHFGEKLGGLTLDYYVLPEDLDKAKAQFAQTPEMMRIFQRDFGEYPFKKDGYKLIEAPYLGMEHQSAVAYGNGFTNGYMGRDWTGVGISPRFDFIIVHESAHEWFGNSVTAADKSDMWIHEGWSTYMEGLYVEARWGKADALLYLNGLKAKVKNVQPIVMERGVNREPDEDQYFKAALMLNTLRSVVNDDRKWFALIRGFYQEFKYKTIMTEDVERYFEQRLGVEVGPVFEEYLRHAAVPVLELRFHDAASGLVDYRWKAEAVGFAMPVRVGAAEHWEMVRPTAEWQTMKTQVGKDAFAVATDLYYLDVNKQ